MADTKAIEAGIKIGNAMLGPAKIIGSTFRVFNMMCGISSERKPARKDDREVVPSKFDGHIHKVN